MENKFNENEKDKISKYSTAADKKDEQNKSKEELIEILRLINKIMRHETINDLSTISAALELYREKKDETILEVINKAVDRSVDRIKKLKEFEELFEIGKLKKVTIGEVLKEVIRNFENHNLRFKIQGNCRVLADETITIVFDNLIRNAIQHGKTDRLDFIIESSGEFCEIKIVDYGSGVTDEIKDRIFEEGFSSCGSMGLGLYIAKKIVERYGGSINILNNKPKGSVFIVRLKSVPEGPESVKHVI